MRILSLIPADFDAGNLVVSSIIRLDTAGSSDAISTPVDSASSHTLRVAPVSVSWLICDQLPDEVRVGAKRQSQGGFFCATDCAATLCRRLHSRFLHPRTRHPSTSSHPK